MKTVGQQKKKVYVDSSNSIALCVKFTKNNSKTKSHPSEVTARHGSNPKFPYSNRIESLFFRSGSDRITTSLKNWTL